MRHRIYLFRHDRVAMELECTCSEMTLEEWERKMKGSRPVNYKWLLSKIRKHLPKLYEALCLDYYNPWENECRVNKQYYILVHSATEYFIKK